MTPSTPTEALAQGWTRLMVGCPKCRMSKTVLLNRLPRGERFAEIIDRFSCRTCGSKPDSVSLEKDVSPGGYATPTVEEISLL